MLRSTLYFGQRTRDGRKVSKRAFKRFLNTIVAPRLKSFTVSDEIGYWKGARENSKRLSVYYPSDQYTAVSATLESLRRYYTREYDQSSVMRIDSNYDPRKVSF